MALSLSRIVRVGVLGVRRRFRPAASGLLALAVVLLVVFVVWADGYTGAEYLDLYTTQYDVNWRAAYAVDGSADGAHLWEPTAFPAWIVFHLNPSIGYGYANGFRWYIPNLNSNYQCPNVKLEVSHDGLYGTYYPIVTGASIPYTTGWVNIAAQSSEWIDPYYDFFKLTCVSKPGGTLYVSEIDILIGSAPSTITPTAIPATATARAIATGTAVAGATATSDAEIATATAGGPTLTPNSAEATATAGGSTLTPTPTATGTPTPTPTATATRLQWVGLYTPTPLGGGGGWGGIDTPTPLVIATVAVPLTPTPFSWVDDPAPNVVLGDHVDTCSDLTTGYDFGTVTVFGQTIGFQIPSFTLCLQSYYPEISFMGVDLGTLIYTFMFMIGFGVLYSMVKRG